MELYILRGYLIIGCVFGFIAVLLIIRDVHRYGINDTSQKTLGIPYGGDFGSTPISLFIFPFIFIFLLWPVKFLKKR